MVRYSSSKDKVVKDTNNSMINPFRPFPILTESNSNILIKIHSFKQIFLYYFFSFFVGGSDGKISIYTKENQSLVIKIPLEDLCKGS